MKQNTTLKYLFVSAAAALALAVSARAGDMPETTPPTATTPVHQGLLGQQYANLTYSYIDLDAPAHADNYTFGFNQPLNTGLDAVFSYDFMQTGLFAGDRLNTQSITAGLRAFSNNFAWGKPYAEADGGYAWQRGFGSKDNSFLWSVGVGAELQVAPAVTVTPYIKYTDTPSLASKDTWDFGVKANYWIDSQWSVTAGFARDDHQANKFTVGTNFRF